MTTKRKSAQDKMKIMTVNWRFYMVIVIICLIYLTLVARAAYIQVIEPDMLQKQGDLRTLRVSSNIVPRGSILDRNGEELAVSVPVETVWADPKVIMAKQALTMKQHWQALADVLDQPVTTLMARVKKHATKRFIFIKRQVSPTVANYIRKLKIPGIHLRRETKRFYPSGEISAHLVGFTDIDDHGVEGVERLFDQQLTGTQGKKVFRKDAKGRKIEILEVEHAVLPQNIQLSIDQRIQAIAYKEIKGAVDAFKASSGSVVVVNVHTGEILALANSPSYNPNNRKNTALHRFRNRAITDVYEPGSTMKPLTMIAAMDFGVAKPGMIVDTNPGAMRIGGRRVSDPRNLGKISLTEILIHSSNMGTTKLALQLPKEFLLDKFFQVGFGEDTGTGLIGESAGIMSDRPRWSEFELATLSWGYGLAITPLQLARLYTAFANGGYKIPFTIEKQSSQTMPESKARVFDEQHTKQLLPMLEAVVNEHVTKAKVEGYRVGGKTGTTLKAVQGGYGNDYVGLFAGIAPLSHPELVVVVVINEPGGDLYHGGDVAAPVFSRVMQGALQILNIAPDAMMTEQDTAQKTTIKTNKEQHYG